MDQDEQKLPPLTESDISDILRRSGYVTSGQACDLAEAIWKAATERGLDTEAK